MSGKKSIPNAEGIAAAARAAAKRGPAPVHLWNPPDCGDLDMRIARDGTWFYEGTPIGRPAMVQLFASVLRKDGDRYVLVTPVEKVGIQVEDVPFIAVDFTPTPDGLRFDTNLGDSAVLDADHPLEMRDGAPYVTIRRNLQARVDRKTFYRLVEIGETALHQGADWFGIRSGGAFFPIQRAEDLEL